MKSSSHIANSVRTTPVVLGLSVASSALATPVHYYYTDWITADPSATPNPGTAHGVITLPDGSTVSVDFAVRHPHDRSTRA